MELNKIIMALKATLDPKGRHQAEEYLEGIKKIVGFTPLLLQILLTDDVEQPVRQAASIYFKNMVMTYWDESPSEVVHGSTTGLMFTIHEQDRHIIRQNIIEAIVKSVEVIRAQLAVSVRTILKTDFPGRWPDIIGKLMELLNESDAEKWLGSLTVLYQLVKNYEYSRNINRQPIADVMVKVLPQLHLRMCHLIDNSSQESVHLQKMILKIYHALVLYHLHTDILSESHFLEWIIVVIRVLEIPVPPESLAVDPEDRPQLVWWKCKKWSARILSRIYDRFHEDKNSDPGFLALRRVFFKHCLMQTIQSMLKVLNCYRQNEYISPQVLYLALEYLTTGVRETNGWKAVKAHVMDIIQTVIFPLLCFSNEDDELWHTDPQEYIRSKLDLFDEFLKPSSAGIRFLHSVMKRKNYLGELVKMVNHVLSTPDVAPQHVDGAFNFFGVLSTKLTKKAYLPFVCEMLKTQVIPRFSDPHGFLRARASYVIYMYSDCNFDDKDLIEKMMIGVIMLILNDPELPVKVDAALAFQSILRFDEEEDLSYITPYVRPLALALLNLLKETECDDISNVLNRLVQHFSTEIVPVAVEIAQNLVNIFTSLVHPTLDDDESDSHDNRCMTAMGVINTLEALIDATEDYPDVSIHLEPVLMLVIEMVISQKMIDYYEEVISLTYSLTAVNISPRMWMMFHLMYELFSGDGIDYFSDMISVFYNYVTVGSSEFLNDGGQRLMALYNVCSTALTYETDVGDNLAVKLMEIIILQFRGKVETFLCPAIELVAKRLEVGKRTSDFLIVCLDLFFACLLHSPQLTIEITQRLYVNEQKETLLHYFLANWFSDMNIFISLHDRKMCLIGLCSLIQLNQRPPVVAELGSRILPSCITTLKALSRLYDNKLKKQNEESSDEEEETEDDSSSESLVSDQESGEAHEDVNMFVEKEEDKSDSGNEDEYSDDTDYDEDLEEFSTVVDRNDTGFDEIVIFKETMCNVQVHDPQWYSSLVSNMSAEELAQLRDVFETAERRRVAKKQPRQKRPEKRRQVDNRKTSEKAAICITVFVVLLAIELSKKRFFGTIRNVLCHFLTSNCTTMLNDNWITTAALLAGVGLASAAVYYYAFIKRKPKKLLEDPSVNYSIVLASKEVCENLNKVNHDTRMFRFSLHSADQVLGLGVGQHVHLSAKINGQLVVRPYTPVSDIDERGSIYFKDTHPLFPEGGKMTQYLDNLKIGDSINIRGPGGRFAIKSSKKADPVQKKYKKVAMLAGGSGITPMYQLIKASLADSYDKLEMHLIYANKSWSFEQLSLQSEQDILLFEELLNLEMKHPTRFRVWFTIDARKGKVWTYSIGFINSEIIKEIFPQPSADLLVLMCGPDAMIETACQPNLDKLGYARDNRFKY
ncbi:Importin-7 [Trichinella nelsoni]|uniref:Importin-7 n=1 Tax=Trichinella nelsoni TaxID=6336 RepID=A0A0V0SKU7_9BILA|nr:Importin-7 [Trichinella nelsoni]